MSGVFSSTSLSLTLLTVTALFLSLSLPSVCHSGSITAFPLLSFFLIPLLLFIGLFMQCSDVSQLESKLENEVCMLMNVCM